MFVQKNKLWQSRLDRGLWSDGSHESEVITTLRQACSFSGPLAFAGFGDGSFQACHKSDAGLIHVDVQWFLANVLSLQGGELEPLPVGQNLFRDDRKMEPKMAPKKLAEIACVYGLYHMKRPTRDPKKGTKTSPHKNGKI